MLFHINANLPGFGCVFIFKIEVPGSGNCMAMVKDAGGVHNDWAATPCAQKSSFICQIGENKWTLGMLYLNSICEQDNIYIYIYI